MNYKNQIVWTSFSNDFMKKIFVNKQDHTKPFLDTLLYRNSPGGTATQKVSYWSSGV